MSESTGQRLTTCQKAVLFATVLAFNAELGLTGSDFSELSE